MSFGKAAIGLFPLGTTPPTPTPELRGKLTGARKFDRGLGTFVQSADGSGSFEGMSSSLQRAVLAIAFNVQTPRTIEGDIENVMAQRIRKALSELIREGVIALDGVSVTDDGRATVGIVVKLRDTSSQEVQEVLL